MAERFVKAMKKYLSLLLAVIIACSLAACSSNSDGEETTADTTVAAEDSIAPQDESTTEAITKAKANSAMEVIESYTNEELGIDVDRDDEDFKFAVKDDTMNGEKCYRVDAIYIVENKDKTVSFDTKGVFYVSGDLSKAYKKDLSTDKLTELPAK